jgi:hypothetical protein
MAFTKTTQDPARVFTKLTHQVCVHKKDTSWRGESGVHKNETPTATRIDRLRVG